MNRPRLILLYQYFHPDPVVSARIYTDLAEDLTLQGWDVYTLPCNRACHGAERYPSGVSQTPYGTIRRIWRPAFARSSLLGRIISILWMIFTWTLAAIVIPRRPGDCMIIGTDPILSPLVILPWRLFHRKIKIFHWCFDVYPDAAIADGLLRERSCTTRLLRRLLRSAYRQCDQVADLGSCMRKLLNDQGVDCPMQTITPWALVEPEIIPSRYSSAREGLFGSAQLTLLYSGTLGRAHSYDLYLQLVEHLATDSIAFCFAGQGARIPEIMARAAQAGSTILLAGFTEESQLPDRLAAGDVHLVSLSENWTGLVVPSKFFAALAMGRPVLFLGSERSAVARWIAEHKVGWTLHAGNLEYVAHALREVQTDAARWDALSQRCHQIYHAHFSRRIMRDRWLTVLQSQTRH